MQTASPWSLLLLVTLSSAALSVHAAPKTPAYQPVALAPFSPGQGSGVAMAINNEGMVCGLSAGPTGARCPATTTSTSKASTNAARRSAPRNRR
jgi:hypothetical protein